jgi:hypothetical protein
MTSWAWVNNLNSKNRLMSFVLKHEITQHNSQKAQKNVFYNENTF